MNTQSSGGGERERARDEIERESESESEQAERDLQRRERREGGRERDERAVTLSPRHFTLLLLLVHFLSCISCLTRSFHSPATEYQEGNNSNKKNWSA